MKNRNLIILFILIIVWSLFFGIYKYFLWGVFKSDTITLQYISGYLSIGTIGAFVFGGLLYELFLEKKYHFFVMLFSILALLSIYLLNKTGISNLFIVSSVTVVIGFFYGLWSVLKNIIISTQIHESGIQDTKINGLANIFFISSIIIGSIGGGLLVENFGLNGIFIIAFILLIGLISGIFFIQKTVLTKKDIKTQSIEYKNSYISDFKFIIKKYAVIMIFISLILTVATILSQKAIEYNVANLGMSGSTRAVILLYSAIGAIIGNIISMKIKTNKWIKFLIFSIFFALIIVLFPTFIYNFTYTSILATIAGVFFGITFNLLETYFFAEIAKDNKKSHGRASIGIVSSIVIAFIMFLVDYVEKWTSFAGVYYFLALIILIIGGVIFNMRKKLNS